MNPQHKLNRLANRLRRLAYKDNKAQRHYTRYGEIAAELGFSATEISRQSSDATRAHQPLAEATLTAAQQVS